MNELWPWILNAGPCSPNQSDFYEAGCENNDGVAVPLSYLVLAHTNPTETPYFSFYVHLCIKWQLKIELFFYCFL